MSSASVSVALVLIMIATGVAGGYANYLLSKSVEETPLPNKGGPGAMSVGRWGYMFIGVVAAFIVPLFLSLVGSDILTDILGPHEPKLEKVFVFVSFCLIAAISSRAFIQTISDKVLALARQQAVTNENLDELTEVVGSQSGELDQNPEPERLTEAETTEVPLSNDERRVLEALQAKPYALRTLKGVVTDSGIDASQALALLKRLEFFRFDPFGYIKEKQEALIRADEERHLCIER